MFFWRISQYTAFMVLKSYVITIFWSELCYIQVQKSFQGLLFLIISLRRETIATTNLLSSSQWLACRLFSSKWISFELQIKILPGIGKNHQHFYVDQSFIRFRYSIISCRDFRLISNIPKLLFGMSISNSSISMYYLAVS